MTSIYESMSTAYLKELYRFLTNSPTVDSDDCRIWEVEQELKSRGEF